jgi:dTDP-glucose pyrophosphorylase
MTVIITMAGLGSRFSKEGYTVPKFKIGARGRTLFEWSLLSLRDYFDQPFVLVTLGVEDHGWLLDAASRLGIGQITLCSRPTLSQGQAETAYDVLEAVAPSEPLWIYNIDTYVAHGMRATDLSGYDGCVPVCPSENPGMSFVRFNEQCEVIQVAEKQVISNWATVGLYGFKDSEIYRNVYRDLYQGGSRVAEIKEYYIAPMYDRMLQLGLRLCAPRLETAAVHVLGTPREVHTFDPLAHAPIGGRLFRISNPLFLKDLTVISDGQISCD